MTATADPTTLPDPAGQTSRATHDPVKFRGRVPMSPLRARFPRQVVIELRKMVNTRSGMALLIITGALVLAASAMVTLLAAVSEGALVADYGMMVLTGGQATAVLLPILGILLITSEWGQRTTLTTFGLEPRRMVVMAAKVVAGVAIAAAAMLLILLWALVSTPVAAAIVGTPVEWSAELSPILGLTAMQVLGVLTGMAFAALILNTPGAVAAYAGFAFVVPIVLPLLGLWGPAAEVTPWIDFGAAQAQLLDPGAGVEWAQLAVSGGLWLVLPFVLGLLRISRSEIS